MIRRCPTACFALALLASPAHAATDGQPGATSTGTFNVTMTVNPPGGEKQISIVGLGDRTATFSGVAGVTEPGLTRVFVERMALCVNVSEAGTSLHDVPITLTLSQGNYQTPNDFYDAFSEKFSMTSGTHTLPMRIRYMRHGADIHHTNEFLAPGVPRQTFSSKSGCDSSIYSFTEASSDTGGLSMEVPKYDTTVANTGPYVAVLQLTVAIN